ncbi:quinate/shikimate dehydrogenase [Escherichia coli]|uniref:Quinate/shikimate dehydrogenase n=1 Tax=Escherichia coli TaxID=562 RepID=A0A376S7X6_ECOLX|nr:quinate/shikimate dehydrogenase [Escherichia coli]
MSSSIKPSPSRSGVNENTDCVVTVTDLADQQAFAEALASADILTNGTKVGMKPLENESLVNDISLLHPGLLVTEWRV